VTKGEGFFHQTPQNAVSNNLKGLYLIEIKFQNFTSSNLRLSVQPPNILAAHVLIARFEETGSAAKFSHNGRPAHLRQKKILQTSQTFQNCLSF